MKENGSFLSRREFFKEAAKSTLPIIGLIALSNIPAISRANPSMDCEHGCSSGCYGGCKDNCIGSCKGDCQLNCTGGCSGNCRTGCLQMCKGGCYHSSRL